MQELVVTDDIYMHAILYAYDFFCNNIIHSPLSLAMIAEQLTEKVNREKLYII